MFTDQLDVDKRCVIIGAAPIFTEPEVVLDSDFIIVCDAGLVHAQFAGLWYDACMGDFDSWTGPIPKGDFETITLPQEKDDTDLMFAVKYAIEKGFRNFLLMGVMGGRTDHFLGNLAVGAYIAEHGGLCVLFGDEERIYIFKDNALTLSPVKDTVVSVLPLGDRLEHVTLTGLYYPLQDATLRKDFPLGVSNKMIDDTTPPVIEVGSGTAMVIVSKPSPPWYLDPWPINRSV